MPATPCALCSITRIIPVINENDAVATAEIRWGQRQPLRPCAHPGGCGLADPAHGSEGLFTADPRTNPDAQLIEEVQTIDDTLRSPCR